MHCYVDCLESCMHCYVDCLESCMHCYVDCLECCMHCYVDCLECCMHCYVDCSGDTNSRLYGSPLKSELWLQLVVGPADRATVRTSRRTDVRT